MSYPQLSNDPLRAASSARLMRHPRRWAAAAMVAMLSLQLLLYRLLDAYLNDGPAGFMLTLFASTAAEPLAKFARRAFTPAGAASAS